MSFNVGTAVGYLDLDTSKFTSGFKSALGDLETFSKSSTGLSGKLTSLGSAFTSVGSSLTKNVTVPLAGIGVAATTTAAKFESAMSEVQAISGATGEDFEALKAKAQEMGAKTKFSASESAAALKYMAMAGWDTEAMLNGINGVMQLAAASGEDLATTSDIVTDAMTAFGMSADQSTRFADVLAQTANKSNTSVALMGETFKYVAPVAGALGYSIEDTSVAIGLMANSGIKGSMAGTSLKNMLTNLAKPTDQVQGYMDALNISMVDQAGNVKPLNKLLLEMRDSFSHLTDAEKAEYAAGIAGKQGMSGLLAIVNSSDEDFNKLTEAINNSSGAAENVAETMQDNLGGQLTILKSTLEGIAISFGNIILPAVKKLASWLQELLNKINNLTDAQKETIVKIAAVVAAIGPALVIIGKLITTIGKLPASLQGLKTGFGVIKTAFVSTANSAKNVKQAFDLAQAGYTGLASQTSKLGTALATSAGSATSFGGAIAAAAGPILAVVAVIAVLVAAFVTLWKNNEEFRNKITAIWNGIKEMFSNFFGQITEKINSLGFNFENFGQVLKALWQGLCDFLAPLFIGVFQNISNTIKVILDVILGVVDFFISIFKGDWEGAWDAIKGIFVAVWNNMVNWFKNIGNVLLGCLDVVLGWFGTSWSNVWTSIKEFFVNIWNSIVDFFVGLWDGIVGAVQSAWDWIVGILSGVGTWIYDNVIAPVAQFFTDLWNGIVNAYHTVIDPWIEIFRRLSAIVYEDIIVPITQFFTDLWNSITSGLQAAWDWIVALALTVAGWVDTNVIQPVVGFFTTMWNTITGAASACWEAIVGVWTVVSGWFNSTVIQPVANFFSSMWEGFKTGARSAWEGVKSIFSSVANFFGSIFSAAWEKVKQVFSTGGKVFNAIKEGILNVFKTVVNALIKGINAVVKVPFEGLNTILKKINNIEIVGVKPFSWLTWRAPVPKIPLLAKGAVLPANNPFLAIVGDQKHGTNVEAPLSTIQEAVATVIRGFVPLIVHWQEASVTLLGYILHAVRGLETLKDDLRAVQAQGVSSENLDFGSLRKGSLDFDYEQIAQRLEGALKRSPVQANVRVEMQDGDVYLNKERVGRSIAPVVSRVVVQHG